MVAPASWAPPAEPFPSRVCRASFTAAPGSVLDLSGVVFNLGSHPFSIITAMRRVKDVKLT